MNIERGGNGGIGWAWVFKQEVLCSVPGGSWWCQEGHLIANVPMPQQYTDSP